VKKLKRKKKKKKKKKKKNMMMTMTTIIEVITSSKAGRAHGTPKGVANVAAGIAKWAANAKQ
jgi:hypothetical protein